MIKDSHDILNDIVELAADRFELLAEELGDAEEVSYESVSKDIVELHPLVFENLVFRLMAERDW